METAVNTHMQLNPKMEETIEISALAQERAIIAVAVMTMGILPLARGVEEASYL